MVHTVTSEHFSNVFASFDKDADGKLSAEELRLCMKAALGEDVSAEDAEELVASADTNGDLLLDEDEFLTLVQRETETETTGRPENEEELWEAFRMYEVKGEGCITPASLMLMLGRLGSHQGMDDCRAMIQMFDLNGDGVVCFSEFKLMMNV